MSDQFLSIHFKTKSWQLQCPIRVKTKMNYFKMGKIIHIGLKAKCQEFVGYIITPEQIFLKSAAPFLIPVVSADPHAVSSFLLIQSLNQSQTK